MGYRTNFSLGTAPLDKVGAQPSRMRPYGPFSTSRLARSRLADNDWRRCGKHVEYPAGAIQQRRSGAS
jgi:hypothetical protein